MIKMNWGKGIAATYISFAILVFGFVIYFMNQDVDLVTHKYYDEEIKYQDQIQRIKRTNELTEKPKIEIEDQSLKLVFPKNLLNKPVAGTINFYRPADQNKDFSILINLENDGVQKIISEKLNAGLWKVKLNWVSGGIEYYDEQVINL